MSYLLQMVLRTLFLKKWNKYQRHPSILAIKENYKYLSFPFFSVTLSNLENEFKSLDYSKSVHEADITTKVLEENMDIFPPFLLNYFKSIIDSSSFSNYLKLVNITPAHKKDSRNGKRNYRPVSIISNISKVFGNIVNRQIYGDFENIFSKQQTEFRRGFST